MTVEVRLRPRFEFFTLILLVIMLSISAWSLRIANWTDDLGLVVTVVQLAVITGLALARSVFSGRTAALFAAFYGLFFTGWQIARSLDPSLTWRDKIVNVGERIGTFVNVVARGQTNHDALIFVLIMAVLFWIFGVLAAWSLFRRGEVWGAIIPCGIVVFTNAYLYDGEAAVNATVAAYWFVALLLIVRSEINQRSGVWHSMRARVPAETSFFVNRMGAFLALALILVAWVAPAYSKYDNLAEFWDGITNPLDATRIRIGDAFGDLRGAVSVIPEYYAEVLNLDAGTEVDDLPVLQAIPDLFPQNNGRFYWRSRVYDRYENGNWSSTITDVVPFDPAGGDIQFPSYIGRERIEVELQPVRDAMVLMFLPSQPLWVNRGAHMDVVISEDAVVDLTSMIADEAIVRGETYRTIALVATPTGLELRNAGSDYPEWVSRYYLQVPNTITDRIVELANRITQGRNTPYDKAVAITAWLRENITYNRQTPAPPPEVEPLDWFLFDYRTGFCNYYASAEVMMLRSLGIPSRLAAGYARGTYEVEQSAFLVTAKDSHAWPEVFFPGIGWVEFEPTVSQEALDRPMQVPVDMMTDRDFLSPMEMNQGREIELPLSSPEDQNLIYADRWGPNRGIVYFLALLNVASLGLLFAVWLYVDPQSRVVARRAVFKSMSRIGFESPDDLLDIRIETTPTGIIYRRWSKLLRRAGVPVRSTQTPHERAEHLAAVLPELSGPGQTIVKAYTQERFGNRTIATGPVRLAWRASWPRMLKAWLRRLFDEWLKKLSIFDRSKTRNE
jgi:hypothetical protein